MRKKLPLFLLLFTIMLKAQVLTFADPTLKNMLVNGGAANFTAYSGGVAVTRIDTNFDNQIQVSEAALIDKLWIEGTNANLVTNIQGIEGFTNVTELGFNGINTTSISLSGMTNLKTIYIKSPALTTAVISGMNGLTTVTFMENPLLTTLNISNCASLSNIVAQQNPVLSAFSTSNLSGLTQLYVEDNVLTDLDLTGCPNLGYFNAVNNKLVSINVSGLTKLTTFLITDNPTLENINASGCTLLNFPQSTFLLYHTLKTADFTNCSGLANLQIPDNLLTSLSLSGCSALQVLNIKNNSLTNLSLTGCSALTTIDCSNNQLTALDLSASPNVTDLRASTNSISNLNFTGAVNLKNVYLDSNQIPSLDLSGNTNLEMLQLDNNPTATLNLSGCTNLENAIIQNNPMVNGDFSNCSSLTFLSNTSTVLNSINVQGCSSIEILTLAGTNVQKAPLTSLNLSGLSKLNTLDCSYSNINSIDLTNCSALTNVFFSDIPLAAVDFSDSPDVKILNVSKTGLENIDVSNFSTFQSLTANDNSNLKMVFAKNGRDEDLFFNTGNTSLIFVCQDDANVAETKTYFTGLGLNSVVVNSYCSFNPGGNYNTITGTIAFDVDNNGCDAADPKQANVKVNLTDGVSISSTFTDANGKYTFFTDAGNFNVLTAVENSSFFSISPTAPNVSFADNNNNIAAQDFCVSALGINSDAEIVIAPIYPAKPGFMAWYEILIRNKGNQTLNGTVDFTYNQNILHYGIATLAPNIQTPGVLGWNYSNLLPFESRRIYVGLNVNTPVQSPPANIGDVLNFTATINPIAGDIIPADNQFVFNQEIIGSFDPNDITCLEGEIVSPSTIGDYLHYGINFENTGTAEAENVVVKVVIDETKYDINSLQLLDASHSVNVAIKGNVAEFIFAKINLSVSKTPPVGGHGNILFKIKTLPSLNSGDEVEKEASIYFDYNEAIDTNTAETIFKSLGNKDFESDKSIKIYPNPTKGEVFINCDNELKLIELFDVQGRILQTVIENKNSSKINLSDKSNGLYFIRITSEKGKSVEKVIKE
ncbi:DUF7619 domain-containing protein [Flavobacterium defluvii]|uniref:Conserved repeat domain-containing protein/Por secretion system C-terminal sorting domain-containing protein n=1 Tax=Flavobacterium defluvii TaxID=370979 RepID=A0A1M5MYN4_9FLAO|nr:T9SS type A sorting domain-containing protein [Flavobacterium defluvii]SHG82039.1 conserved repeat domain-containing protein/Por secretion system C-terminal sorting domain-containing protein [Flavobacterium defluvii]